MATTAEPPRTHTDRRASLPVAVSSSAVPATPAGQLTPDGPLLAVAYAVPLVVWPTQPDKTQSPSEDMHPFSQG